MNYPDYEYEYSLIDKGYNNCAGVDEVARGNGISSVFAGVVIINNDMVPVFENVLKDSKKLSENKRKEYSDLIKVSCVWAIGEATAQEIDDINILNATKLAMYRAVVEISDVDYLIVDGNMDLTDVFSIPHTNIVKGDSKCLSIAAASIIAKDTQCTRMYELDKQYPMYDLANNKGYLTARHIKAIEKYGPCPLHRKTFKRIREYC